MDAMFRDAESFNQPLNSWDTKKVRSMVAMFSGAKKFNQPLDKWNVGRADVNRYILERDNEKLVTGLLYLDNYEEALNSVEEVRRSLLVALIERKLNKYLFFN